MTKEKTTTELKKEFVERIKEIVESKKKDLKFEINKSKTTGVTIWLVCKGDRSNIKKSLHECFDGVDFINKYEDVDMNHSVKVTQITGKEPYNKSSIIKVNIIYKHASEGKLKISTAEQEQIALEILKYKISGISSKWNSFDEMWEDEKSGLQKIYKKTKDIKALGDWYKHFVLIFNDVNTTPKIPKGEYKVFCQSDGFMEWVSKKVREGYGISKKDSWNPADVWLIKDTRTEEVYKKRIDALVQENKRTKNVEYISLLNDVLREAYHKRDIVGISLKKNNGKKLFYEETNLNRNAQKHEVPGVKFEEVQLNLSFKPDRKTKIESFSKTCIVIVQEIGKIKYKFAIKSNTGGVGNITYEFLKFSGATTMEGKVPKDLLQELLKSYGRDFRMPLHTDYENKSFDSGNWKTKLNLIKLQLKCPIGDEIENFLDILESTWVDHNKPTDINYAIIQIIDFLFILAQIQHLGTGKLNMFLTKLLYMSQKKNMVGQDRYGPFGKLY